MLTISLAFLKKYNSGENGKWLFSEAFWNSNSLGMSTIRICDKLFFLFSENNLFRIQPYCAWHANNSSEFRYRQYLEFHCIMSTPSSRNYGLFSKVEFLFNKHWVNVFAFLMWRQWFITNWHRKRKYPANPLTYEGKVKTAMGIEHVQRSKDNFYAEKICYKLTNYNTI